MNLVEDFLQACKHWNTTPALMRGHCRKQEIATARTSIMVALARSGHNRRLVCMALGNKHRGTLEAAIKREHEHWFGADWQKHLELRKKLATP